MMLPTQGPNSTLMEDLQALGLTEGKDSGPTAASNKMGDGYGNPKGDDYAGPPGKTDSAHENLDHATVEVGDSDAGHRTNVGVRSDGKFDTGAKAEDEEYAANKMVPGFMIPTEEEVHEAEEQAMEQAEESQLAKAWQVVHTYFAEDTDGLNEEGLRGVINAMGFCLNTSVEDIANLTVENTRLTEAVNELTGLLYEADLSEAKKCGDEEDEDEEDEDEEGGKGGKMPPWMMKGKEESRSYRGAPVLTEDSSLNSILDEIRNIGAETPAQAQAVDKQAKIVEAFEGLVGSAEEIVGRIIGVIAEDQGIAEDEEPDLYEDDQRVQIAQFFQGIAEDAKEYLARLTEGDVPFRVAEADLGKLYGDMEKGIEAMHTVA